MTMWAKELNSKDDAERTSIKGRMELTTFSQTKVAMSIAGMRIQFCRKPDPGLCTLN